MVYRLLKVHSPFSHAPRVGIATEMNELALQFDPLVNSNLTREPCCLRSGCCNKMPYTEWLKQDIFISYSSGIQKSEIKVLADSDLGEDPLSRLANDCLRSTCSQSEDLRDPKDTNPIIGTPPSLSHLKVIPLCRPHLQIPSHWGLELQHRSLREYKHSAHNTCSGVSVRRI